MKRIAVSTIAVATILLGATAINAQDARLTSIVDEVNQANQVAQASQKTIDKVADATAKIFGDFKGVLKTNAGLRAYNAQQKRVITKQEEEIVKIKKSIGQIDEIKRQITPLMQDMIEDLREFIGKDIPFLKEEREARIESLIEVMDNPNVSDPERFRVVLEAYKAEVQYGSKVHAYEDSLDDGRSVNFVRIGRIGFYYQTKDTTETAVWDTSIGAWKQLDSEYTSSIKQLIKMAQRRTQSDIVTLPIAAPVGK
ncbi:MAG: DUF3450 domain-containing protein [Kordiimonadaceae bacterium]|nr:DUF3450 domain-containing protein [Kordiimonadaceae bacterium]